MTLVINHDTLAKLSHGIQEIRVRTLHDIENKVKRALWEQQEIKFSPTSLVKCLIRWFGNVPICEEEAALELLSLLLTSKYGLDIINHFTSSRLVKELGKIKYLIGTKPEHSELVDNVVQLVNNFKETEPTRHNPESLVESLASLKIESIDLTESPNARTDSNLVYTARGPNYFTKCWTIPLPSDEKILKELNHSLHPDGDEKDIQHAYDYLVPSINDYPPEFFLQPPYIVHSLLKLLDARKASTRTTTEMFHRLTVAMQKRLKSLQLTSMYCYQDPKQCPQETQNVQISVTAFVHELFLFGINGLKDISDDVDLQETNKIFNLFHELIELATAQQLEDFHYRDVRHELGYLVKHFRQSWESKPKCFATRTKYLVTINILSKFLRLSNCAGQAESNEDNDTCFPHKPRYNPAEFETMNSTSHRRVLEEGDQNWLHELQIAALDYPMRHIYPSIYGPVLEQALKTDNRKLQILLSADEIFTPAVTILRQPTAMTDEELIFQGLEAIDTLYLHRSTGMVKLLIKAVGNCHSHFEGNIKLKDTAEKLVLRLLSHSDDQVKSTAYDQCNGVIKDFISSLDEGAILTHRRSFPKTTSKLGSLGIPLTVEILVEVICFGYCSSNKKIQQQAETIMLFVLNSRAFLLDRWTDLLDIILPVLPLLQTVAIIKKQSTLSRAIIALLHPDSGLPMADMIRGNLRFLFQEDTEIREEALTRVLFLMSIATNAQQYTPNIDHIRDTISNAICLMKSRYDVGKHLTVDVYEVSTIKSLLETLQQDNCDPAIRRSALVQLNVMAEDPTLCEIIHKANGWAFVLQVLDNALREEHFLDYPDSAVPAIGILTKLCFAIPEFRRFLADNVNVYHLIVRSLLAYHHLPIFKPDCCSLLFLLLFSDYTLGCGKSISLPVICNSYKIPFVCEHHWKFSPFNELSYLEEIFIDAEGTSGDICGVAPVEGESIIRLSRPCGIECATSRMRRTEVAESESVNQTAESFTSMQNYCQVAWQYLRLCFAGQWFDAFENILVNANKCHHSPKSGKTAEEDAVIDYGLLPPHLLSPKRNEEDEVIDLEDHSLHFDRILRLTKVDIDMIRTTHVDEIFRNSLKSIATASSHAEVSIGLSGLESNLILPMQQQLLHNSIVKHLKKFILTPPNTPADEKLLIDVIGLLGDLILIGYENVLVWIVTLLFEQTSIFIQLLKSESCSGELFMKNVDFIKIVLLEALSCENSSIASLLTNEEGYQIKIKREHNFNLLNKLFEIITNRLDNDLQKCDLMKILSLVSLARVLVRSGLIDFENKFLNHVVNKLCSYISLIRSITYSGSTITKSCLVIMSLILDQMKEVHLKAKHFKIIALQCSHTSVTIRSCAWNVLAKMAKSLSGAHSIIKECAYLPGGIHASCVETLLDPEEASLVKESATGLLINLLSHKVEKGGLLHKFVVPFDKGGNSQLDADPLATVLSILKKHRFFETALESFQNFTTRDYMVVGEYEGVQMVTCDVVKSYTIIFSSLVDLKSEMVEFLIEKCCLQQLMNCVSKVPLHPGRAAFLMVSEICNLMVRCINFNKNEICELMAPYQAVIGGIIYLLNVELYGECGENVLSEVTGNIMHLLNALAMHKIGNQLITCVLSELKLEPLARLIIRGISNNKQKNYQITCLRFLTVLVLTSDVNISPASEFQSFLGLLETVQLDIIDGPPAAGGVQRIRSMKRQGYSSDEFFSDEDRENQDPNGRTLVPAARKEHGDKRLTTASELIFVSLMDQFQIICAKDKPENGALVSTVQKRMMFSAIQVMLRQSEKAKKVARTSKFLEMLLDRLGAIYSGIGVSYQDFVRKNGDSKKAPIVEELSFLAGIISAWFLQDILVHQANVTHVCKIFLQFWPWISNNRDLENDFMKALVCLTENSIVVCKSLTVTFPGHPHAILKLIIAAATAETGKVKGMKSELILLTLCLRVIINCCSCHEGRVMIAKFNVLDNIMKLHPAVTKLQRPWIVVTKLWLEFWEIYSRHNDVTEVKHLTVLGALLRKSSPELRKLSLEIMRNMSYVANNRPALLSSDDYMYALKSVLDGSDPAEQLIVVCSIWKVIANNHKGRSAIKSSPIPRRLNALLKQCSLLEHCEDDDLFNVLNIVVKLLHS